MHEFSFQALGTEWSVSLDGAAFPPEHAWLVRVWLEDFERRFSRFVAYSEVNAFRSAPPGRYVLSDEFLELLERATLLRSLTDDKYNPAVGSLLEQAGYGLPSSATHPIGKQTTLAHWSLEGKELVTAGAIAFDLGGMGKGYAIDRVADILWSLGYRHFLVEGGGDMFGTDKADGESWTIALEYPGQPELAAGTVALRYQGIAVSDRFRRRSGAWHHIVDPVTEQSVMRVDGCAAVAASAWDADCMTSSLFLGTREQYPACARALHASYLVFLPSGQVVVSADWPGTLFT